MKCWQKNGFLRERNFGRLSSLTLDERERRFSRELELRKRDAFYWLPPSGESLADVCLRVDYILSSLRHSDLRPSSALIITHFNVMQMFRTRIERIRQSCFSRELLQVPPRNMIRNASVIHYTRKNPYTNEIADTYYWRRIITPWREEFSNPPWEEIEYKYLSNQDIISELDENQQPLVTHSE